ncbi:MAG: tetratricopeptide repeat protein [Candidatus Omnitrophica bacterium]|jgi:lysophospholipase L1-like esterase|nr:tetratricopeptide repeat protein [Candidatus Omnitrophota bacterium]
MLKQKIGVFVLGTVAAVVCLELLLRVFGVGYLLYRRGFPDDLKDNPAVYKILCLGDSFTLGVGAGKGEDYPAQLNGMFKESGLRKFAVINEGVGGQNSSELLYSLDKKLDKYKPDMVVLMMGMIDGHNMHLHNWALGQRGWPAKLSSWFTGLKIYKLFNYTGLSLERLRNIQDVKQEADFTKKETIQFKPLVSTAKQKADSIVNEARRLYRDGQNEKAAEVLIRASNKENVWEYLGIAKEYKAYETEERIIKKVLNADAQDEWLRFTLAKIYLMQNKFYAAEKVFKSILENNPDNNYIRFDLACLYMSLNRYDNAEELLKDSIRVHGKSPRAEKLLAYCYEAQGKTIEAGALHEDINSYRRVTDLNFSAIKNKILARNIRLVIMSYPQGNYVSENLMHGLAVVDNLKSFNNLPVFEKNRLFSADDNHCNGQGYKLIAENLFNYISGSGDF